MIQSNSQFNADENQSKATKREFSQITDGQFNDDVRFIKDVKRNLIPSLESIKRLETDGLKIQYMPFAIEDYEKACFIAIASNPYVIRDIDLTHIRNIKSLAKEVVSANGTLIQHFLGLPIYQDIELWHLAIDTTNVIFRECPFPKGEKYQSCVEHYLATRDPDVQLIDLSRMVDSFLIDVVINKKLLIQ